MMTTKWILSASGGAMAVAIAVWVVLSHFSSPEGLQRAAGPVPGSAPSIVAPVEGRQVFHAPIEASDVPDAPEGPQEPDLTGVESPEEELIILAERWAHRDPAGAAHWAAGLPEEANSSEVIASATAIWAQHAPADAAQFVAWLPSGAARDAAIVATVSTWGRHDPAAAAMWVEQFPAEDVRPKAYERLLLAWAEDDPLSAVEWSIRLPDSRARDMAVSAFCTAILERYPAFAFALGQSVADDNLRRQSLQNVARRWLAINPQAARRAFLQWGLEPGISAEILQSNDAGPDLPAPRPTAPGS